MFREGSGTLLILTDGGISCGALSSPIRPGFTDCNGCVNEWESPSNLVSLVTGALNDPVKPIQTFIVGLPGSDTTLANGCGAPPYSMKLALSAIAFAGLPTNSTPGYTGTVFTQLGSDPTVNCHQDLSTGFSTPPLTSAIVNVVAAVSAQPIPSLGYLGIALLGTLLGSWGIRRLRGVGNRSSVFRTTAKYSSDK